MNLVAATCLLYTSLCLLWDAADSEPQALLLISLDGLGWDFASKAKTPYLDFLAHTGVTVPYVQSVFPTITYPCHYSMVTGLYPESHGIVGNSMYDPVFKAKFGGGTTDPRWWNSAEPIWVTNQRYKGRSGVLYWPAYNVEIKGVRPAFPESSPSTNIDPFNKTGKVLSFEKRVEKVIGWLTGRNPPNFVAVYFEDPDKTCHEESWPEVQKSIERLDQTVGLLVERLKSCGLLERVNIMITADHGMTNTSCNRVIHLDKYVNPKHFDFWDSFFNMLLVPHTDKEDYVYNRLKKIPHLHVYHKNETPEHFHFKHNRRISPLVLVPSEGWLVSSKKGRLVKKKGRWTGITHGFSCRCLSMSTAFIARGPAFKQNFVGRPFNSVSLYELMCKVLGIPPLPNNGTLSATAELLRPAMVSNSYYYY